jgi:hypothetical protein
MRIAFWLPLGTNTHSENVILISFPLQQWLQERVSTLRYTYPACIVYSVLAHFLVELRHLLALESERRRFIFKMTQEFYVVVLRRLKKHCERNDRHLAETCVFSSPQQLCRISMALRARSFSQVTELRL